MRTYEPMAGDRISDTCKTLKKMTAEHNEPVQAEFIMRRGFRQLHRPDGVWQYKIGKQYVILFSPDGNRRTVACQDVAVRIPRTRIDLSVSQPQPNSLGSFPTPRKPTLARQPGWVFFYAHSIRNNSWK